MEKTSATQRSQDLQQIVAIKAHDPKPFKTFIKGFTPKEKKQFLKNLQSSCSHMITRHMRKMKEASQKMRESFKKN